VISPVLNYTPARVLTGAEEFPVRLSILVAVKSVFCRALDAGNLIESPGMAGESKCVVDKSQLVATPRARLRLALQLHIGSKEAELVIHFLTSFFSLPWLWTDNQGTL
jgi:hypothetical protein